MTHYAALLIPVILISLTIHEYSHGRVAYALGDDTAKKLGRLSFNPLRHLDPMGVVFFYFMGFGWAKPVPVNFKNLRDPHRDMLYIAAAGPASNLVLAVICGFLLRVVDPFEHTYLFPLLCMGIFCNIMLAIFNMIPVFPLDGSSVLKGLVPPQVAWRLSHLDRFSVFLLLGVFLVDHFAHTRILGRVVMTPTLYMVELLTQEAFPSVWQTFIRIFSS